MKAIFLLAIFVCGQAFRVPDRIARSPNDSSQIPADGSPESRNPVNSDPATDKVEIREPTLAFALNLGLCKNATLPDCSGNSIFSPLSITSTMSLLMAGSDGSTHDQLRAALGYQSASDEDINVKNREVMRVLTGLANKKGIELSIANAIFSTDLFRVNYIQMVKEFYFGQVHKLQRSTGAEQINDWVSKGTNGKITDIVADLSPNAKMIVANVVYMNANWEEPFDATLTSNETFHVSPNETLSVPTMFTTQTVDYHSDAELRCKIVALPYKGGKLAMYVVVPTERNGLDSLLSLESKLDASVVNGLLDKMSPTQLSIQLPKFNFRQKLNLKSSLEDMGVVDLFRSDRANLTRMFQTPGNAVDSIVHEAVIEVNESGTEAAGATVVTPTRGTTTLSLTADQPFLFFVMERSSRTVLFSGRVVRP